MTTLETAGPGAAAPAPDPAVLDATFRRRLDATWPELAEAWRHVYGTHPDGAATLDAIVQRLAAFAAARSPELRSLDADREREPDWFQRPDMIGYVFYVDRFAGTLRGILDHVDHLGELGVRYVHLMPLLKPREGDNDGGYAVADYAAVRPDLGTMDDLEAVAAELRGRGMSTCIDLVVNHTAAEHPWALAAAAGDARYGSYYRIYPDRTEPDRWERTLPEVFPDFAPGNFTQLPDGRWVWTTFNRWQWDLDWSNPAVFAEMLGIVLALAAKGIDVFRLDAVAFMWKRLGTNCQNQPEVHWILRALRACLRIAAPAVIFKAEAIVGPDDLAPYLGVAAAGVPAVVARAAVEARPAVAATPGVPARAAVEAAPAVEARAAVPGVPAGRECDLAYHNTLMVQYWSSLAARDTRLMTHVLRGFPVKPARAAWGTYIRCHDDIGWAITEEDAAAVGWDGKAHRAFLSAFYAGSFPGSFARGAVFQHNPLTGDSRTSGSFASLAGLETALESGDPAAIDLAVGRMLAGFALVLGWDGIPLLYMGDEIGLRNDWSFLHVPAQRDDNRWVHRPRMDWDAAARRDDPASVEGRIFGGVRHLVRVRAGLPQLHAAAPLHVLDVNDPALFAFKRGELAELLAVHNLTERPRTFDLGSVGGVHLRGGVDVLTGRSVRPGEAFALGPYATAWVVAAEG
ncbi:MAG: alpha-amylase family protein [Chloroflexota bacterium]